MRYYVTRPDGERLGPTRDSPRQAWRSASYAIIGRHDDQHIEALVASGCVLSSYIKNDSEGRPSGSDEVIGGDAYLNMRLSISDSNALEMLKEYYKKNGKIATKSYIVRTLLAEKAKTLI
jgi:hypothetical protein